MLSPIAVAIDVLNALPPLPVSVGVAAEIRTFPPLPPIAFPRANAPFPVTSRSPLTWHFRRYPWWSNRCRRHHYRLEHGSLTRRGPHCWQRSRARSRPLPAVRELAVCQPWYASPRSLLSR